MGSFVRGLGMGLAIGMSPGPVLVLVLTQSFQFGVRSGLLIAGASALATFPVVLIALSFQLAFQNSYWAQKALALVGIFFLLYLSFDALKTPAIQIQASMQPTFSFVRGIFATMLFPVPYLFWISVGIPLSTSNPSGLSLHSLGAFVTGFVLILFAVNAAVAVLASRCGKSLPLRLINILCRSTALIFLGFAGSLAHRYFWAG